MIQRIARERKEGRRASASLGFALALVLAAAGCAPETEEPALGRVTFRLDWGGGVMLSSANYTLTGPNAFRRAGTLAVGNNDTIMTTFQNLPTGNGYRVVVEGTASDDLNGCTGDVMFNVTSSMTAIVTIPLACTGLAVVSAAINVCPQIDELSAVPAQAVVGGAIHLTAASHDTDQQPGALTGTWTSTGGALSATTLTGATFTCTAPGTFTVGLRVTDGDASSGCPDVLSVTVVCAPVVGFLEAGGVASAVRRAARS